MKYKFITIEQVPGEERGGKPVYEIESNNRSGDELGEVEYYPPWKRFVFSANPVAVFSASCLRDILDFMENHAK